MVNKMPGVFSHLNIPRVACKRNPLDCFDT